jgi:predicted nucleic acid-binding protein
VIGADLVVFDTSALAKRFVQEAGSERVVAICRDVPPETLWISQLVPLEMRSLLRLARNTGRITEEQAHRVADDFRREVRRRFQVWEFLPQDWRRAGDFIDRHAIRPADALQLAATVSVREARGSARAVLVCSDQGLARAAKAQGVTVLDPATA